jgi:hypothetical protein
VNDDNGETFEGSARNPCPLLCPSAWKDAKSKPAVNFV